MFRMRQAKKKSLFCRQKSILYRRRSGWPVGPSAGPVNDAREVYREMIVLPLGWTNHAYDVPVFSGLASRKRRDVPAAKATHRAGVNRRGRDGHRDISVPLGWTGNSYGRSGSRTRG
jgi:hypothetical protein